MGRPCGRHGRAARVRAGHREHRVRCGGLPVPRELCTRGDIVGLVPRSWFAHQYWSAHRTRAQAIFAPVNASGPLPVMVWIHGGGFIGGDGNVSAAALAARGVAVVTVQYRLGIFGFLALPELAAESGTNSTGNLGVQDQAFALRWVRDNAGAFGGDAARVTIFGESAGAFSVCYHLASPGSAGLFAGAIMESGSCEAMQLFHDYPHAVAYSQEIAAAVGCPGTGAALLACLRAARAAALQLNQTISPVAAARAARAGAPPAMLRALGKVLPPLYPVMSWGPTVDGSPAGLLHTPIVALQSGAWNRVPLLAGTNKNEVRPCVHSRDRVVPRARAPRAGEPVRVPR